MVEMRLSAVRVELPTNTPVVLLQEVEGEGRTLPIFIGSPEATAIAYVLQRQPAHRPFTHDLMKNVLDELGARLERIVITELREGTFYAELHLDLDGRRRTVSSRPSDAINLAARTGSPIYCDDELLAAEGIILPPDDEDGAAAEAGAGDQDELVQEFNKFIEQIRPEDFGGGS